MQTVAMDPMVLQPTPVKPLVPITITSAPDFLTLSITPRADDMLPINLHVSLAGTLFGSFFQRKLPGLPLKIVRYRTRLKLLPLLE